MFFVINKKDERYYTTLLKLVDCFTIFLRILVTRKLLQYPSKKMFNDL